MTLKPNQIIDDRYQVTKHLGQGGMGTVWRAIDQQAGGDVVIKMPLDGSNQTVLDRFANEAKMMREHSMGNPNILDIQGMGNIGEVPYYVMRYLPGGSLEDRCPLVDEQGQPDFRPESYEWLLTIGKALDFLHSKDVLHRDVKPGNILFNESSDAYLVDFGIVKTPLEASSFTSAPTAANTSPGTIEYMPPEVLAGKTDAISGLGDQYALAVTLYEMIAGKRPFTGPTETAIYHAIQRGPAPLMEVKTSIPPSASTVITRALSSDPEKRFKTCREFANSFLSALQNVGESILAPPVAVPTSEGKTKLHVGPVEGKISGGNLVDSPRIQPGPSPSEGRLFDNDKSRVVPKKPEGPPTKTGSRTPALIGIGALLLTLISGGLYLSGAFYSNADLSTTNTISPNQPTGVSPGSSADSSSSSPATIPVSFELAENLFNGTGGESTDKSRAISMFEKLARDGSLKSQKRLADFHAEGELGEVDLEEAFKWHLLAAEAGDSESQLAVGAAYSNGQQGTDRDLDAAVLWLRRAKQLGETDAGEILAKIEAEIKVEMSAARPPKPKIDTLESLLKSADAGEVDSQFKLAGVFENGEMGEGKNSRKAFQWYLRAAEQDHLPSQLTVAKKFDKGAARVTASFEDAVKWYQRAAMQGDEDAAQRHEELTEMGALRHRAQGGDAAAQFELAQSLLDQDNENHSLAEAAVWMRKAAEQEHGLAQLGLGFMLEHRFGMNMIERNEREAALWYRKAFEQGESGGGVLLAAMLEEGRGVKKNLEEANQVFKNAASDGVDEFSTDILGLASQYEQGYEDNMMLVEEDLTEALRWYHRAAKYGNGTARYKLGALYKDGVGVAQNQTKAISLFQEAIEVSPRSFNFGSGAFEDRSDQTFTISIDGTEDFKLSDVRSDFNDVSVGFEQETADDTPGAFKITVKLNQWYPIGKQNRAITLVISVDGLSVSKKLNFQSNFSSKN